MTPAPHPSRLVEIRSTAHGDAGPSVAWNRLLSGRAGSFLMAPDAKQTERGGNGAA